MQDQSKLREYYVWSLRRSSKESRMEGEAGGRVSKEELFSFSFSFDPKKVIIALLVFGLAVLVYKKATNASEKDD